MTIFFTSDTHFNHFNCIKYCNRPFKTVEEMNEVMVERWNKVVNDKDTIYHLGDFGLGSVIKLIDIGKRLNGIKYLCPGSHDNHAERLVDCFCDIEWCNPLLDWKELIQKTVQPIFLSHYLHKIWPLSHYNSIHLYGHSHGTMNEYAAKEGKLLDVGVDSHNFTPWALDEIVEVMKTRPDNFNLVKRGINDK